MKKSLSYFLPLLILVMSSSFDVVSKPKPKVKYKPSWAETWKGKYKGKAFLMIGADTSAKFDMSLEISPIVKDSLYNWIITYSSPDMKTSYRPYKLVLTDKQQQRWAVDEGNDLVLDGFYQNDRFSSFFQVNRSLLHADYQKIGKNVQVTIGSFSVKNAFQVGDTSNTDLTIYSFPVGDVQYAMLKKVK